MSSKTFKYEGNRRGKNGFEKSFDTATLTAKNLKQLEEKGWVEVKAKPKAKPKKK